MTTMAILLGEAATHRGTMDVSLILIFFNI